MIDEKKLIEELGYYISHTPEDSSGRYAYKRVKALIDRQPKVDEWITVSEGLPKKAGKYLVTIKSGGTFHTTVRRFNPKPTHPMQIKPLFTKHVPLYSGWERRTNGVVAWSKLPEPFKGE